MHNYMKSLQTKIQCLTQVLCIWSSISVNVDHCQSFLLAPVHWNPSMMTDSIQETEAIGLVLVKGGEELPYGAKPVELWDPGFLKMLPSGND